MASHGYQREPANWIAILVFAMTLIAAPLTTAVEVHFEAPDAGFFLKHSTRQTMGSLLAEQVTKASQDSVLSVDRFTVVQTSQPVSIRASYGPFSTKQTVPARYIVPDMELSQPEPLSQQHVQNATAALLDLQQSNVHLDISAHLVRNTIPRDSPVVRVLFHAGADPSGHFQRQKICVLLHVAMGTTRTPLKGRCMPEGEDGVCVAEVVIPSNWWPALPPPDKDGKSGTAPKVPQRLVQVSYSVFEPPSKNPEQCEPKVQIQPLTPFAQVPLTQALSAYKELRADDTLTMLVPHQPLYPMSKIHVPVFLQPQGGQNIAVFIIRARVKAGMRILGATASSDDWTVHIEKENPKHTVARVTAYRKDQDPDSNGSAKPSDNWNQVVEVFSWLLEVANDTKEHWDGGRIVWSVSYVNDGPKLAMKEDGTLVPEMRNHQPEEIMRKKLIAKLDIQKDDIQAVLPISKNWEVMNTAVLTGRQVSQAMKVFIVSQAGKVADVTLQSSCHADDESVIKVSSSCSSVYVDGSEARGSSNATVLVKYGTYSGMAKYIVWMPEFPLEVSVTDFRLSQIKGWKVPEEINNKLRRRKRAYGWTHHADDFSNGVGSDRLTCRARYQQSPVEVYARFLAMDQDSGRVSYLISRKTGLRVTDLVQPLLRVADPKIATLKGRTLQGRAMGRTDVQVLSPITGRVIGAKEIRVGSDKVSISKLIVRVVSGLQLNITPDSSVENGYVAETSVTRKLTAQYQEGLLDIDIEFSDGARTPLRDVSVDDYFLMVESLDIEVVAFAPMLASHHPRVIAVGEGNGDLLRVTLLLSEECRLRRNIPISKQSPKSTPGPLASSLASVQVDFSGSNGGVSSPDSPARPDTVQNDGFSNRAAKSGGGSDLSDILIGIPLQQDDHKRHEPNVQARQHKGGVVTAVGPPPGHHVVRNHHADTTPLEIGMYVLLAAFCFAIAVFMVSCVVYAAKFRPITIEQVQESELGQVKSTHGGRRGRDSTTNAHDWVWLGRSTLDQSTTESVENVRDSRVRITANPMPLNYVDPEDALAQVTSFDNPNHIQLPAVAPGPVDTSTYNKRDRRLRMIVPCDQSTAPPLPPHGMPGSAGSSEYRPPVPPHRNVGITANNVTANGQANVARILPEVGSAPKRQPQHHHHHPGAGPSGASNCNRSHSRTPSNMQQLLIQQQLSRRSPATVEPLNKSIPMQSSMAPANVGQQLSPVQQLQLQQGNAGDGHNLTRTQQQLNAALFNTDSDSLMLTNGADCGGAGAAAVAPGNENNKYTINSTRNSAAIVDEDANDRELHMAEQLVANADKHKRSAFQFDTIEPKARRNAQLAAAALMQDSGIGLSETSRLAAGESPSDSLSSPLSSSSSGSSGDATKGSPDAELSDDNGGFVTPPSVTEQRNKARAVKRATVVGNPMFSNSPDSEEAGPTESLGLDDLDMDYEQIMNYFDNLKESNA